MVPALHLDAPAQRQERLREIAALDEKQQSCFASKKSKMASARSSLIAACGQPSSSHFTDLTGKATITGVGFFDIPHGQTGVAPNAIELHPVLKLSAANCSQ